MHKLQSYLRKQLADARGHHWSYTHWAMGTIQPHHHPHGENDGTRRCTWVDSYTSEEV